MSIKPRTIDNIGVDASSRYARDLAQLDPKLIEESSIVAPKASSSVLKPYIATDFEQYLQSNKQILWAKFEPPPNYYSHERPLFSHQLIPSLGGWEKQEADADKLAMIEDALSKNHTKKKKQNLNPEIEKEQSELKIILKLLQTIDKLNQALTLINARRNQYQKG